MSENASKRYALSYTAASLRRAETQILAREYQTTPDWTDLRHRSVNEDLLMIRQESSRQRITGELIKRLKSLTPAELSTLASTDDARASAALAWLAICRTYEFIAAFVVNVVGERWRAGITTLGEDSYQSFVAEQSLMHGELLTISEQTSERLRSQLFTIMREMEFLLKDGTLLAYQFPSAVLGLICDDDRLLFPTAVV